MENISVHLSELMPLIKESLDGGQSVRFCPMGISMLPMLKEGRDAVTLSPVNKPLKKYDLPLYRRDDGSFVLHRIVKACSTFTCIGDNQYVYEKGIREDQIIGVVTSFEHKGKEYSVNSLSFLLYCRIWHHSRFLRRVIRSLKYRLSRLLKNR